MLATLSFDTKILWFLLVGGLNTALGFGLFPLVYWVLQDYREHYIWMLVICHVTTVGFAYFTNKFLVFRTQGRSITEMTKFGGFHLVYFAIMMFLVPFFVEHLHYNPIIIQFSVSVLVVITSFFWYDKVVFLLSRD